MLEKERKKEEEKEKIKARKLTLDKRECRGTTKKVHGPGMSGSSSLEAVYLAFVLTPLIVASGAHWVPFSGSPRSNDTRSRASRRDEEAPVAIVFWGIERCQPMKKGKRQRGLGPIVL